jgi:hypothetical protein
MGITLRDCANARAHLGNSLGIQKALRDEISTLLFAETVGTTLGPELKLRKELLIKQYQNMDRNFSNLFGSIGDLEELLGSLDEPHPWTELEEDR